MTLFGSQIFTEVIKLKSSHQGDPKVDVLTKGDPGTQTRGEGDDVKTQGGAAMHSPRRRTVPPPSRPREDPLCPRLVWDSWPPGLREITVLGLRPWLAVFGFEAPRSEGTD